VEFRNLRIKELPSTGATPEVTAPLDPGWRALFNGLDLRGWRTTAATGAHWSVVQEKITLKPAGQDAEADATLWTDEEFGAAEFVIDFQPPRAASGQGPTAATLLVRGKNGRGVPVPLAGAASGKFSRFIVTLQNQVIRVQCDAQPPQEFPLPSGTPDHGAIGLAAGPGAGLFMNLHARKL
jgi:hypothetical protein